MNRFAVVILNWNGASETMECLRSILDGEHSSLPLVIDNGSDDDSCEQIKHWCDANAVRILSGTAGELVGARYCMDHVDVLLLLSAENLGFAKGCNLGLRTASELGCTEVVFLNNDTVVWPGALSLIMSRLRTDRDLFAIIPQIRIHGTGKIWNCGGTISRLGFRRYHFSSASVAFTSLPQEIVCTFFTGCCFAVRTEEFCARGGFTERFFFGEEDFELGLWMLDYRKRAVCLTAAVVDHKVGASVSQATRREAAKIYVYYLNRFIHMRLRFGIFRWVMWSSVYLPYIVYLVLRMSAVSASELPRFIWSLVRNSLKHDGVDRSLFMGIIRAKRS